MFFFFNKYLWIISIYLFTIQDYAISIATIHHLSTESRRIESIQSLFKSVLLNNARILIYVWALEQGEDSRRAVPENSTTSASNQGLDVWVPWVHRVENKVYNRYYHLFQKGELRNLTEIAAQSLNINIEILQEGYEKDNWYIEVKTCGKV